jgi:hypothetical protein
MYDGLEFRIPQDEPSFIVVDVPDHVLKCIQLVCQFACVRRELIVDPCDVFAKVDADRSQVREEILEAGPMLNREVASVVDNNIE